MPPKQREPSADTSASNMPCRLAGKGTGSSRRITVLAGRRQLLFELSQGNWQLRRDGPARRRVVAAEVGCPTEVSNESGLSVVIPWPGCGVGRTPRGASRRAAPFKKTLRQQLFRRGRENCGQVGGPRVASIDIYRTNPAHILSALQLRLGAAGSRPASRFN